MNTIKEKSHVTQDQKRGRGRPPLGATKNKVMAIRLLEADYVRLEQLAEKDETKPATLAAKGILQYLDKRGV